MFTNILTRSFFFQVAFLYTSTKVLQDISYYYLPLFLIETITFEKVLIYYVYSCICQLNRCSWLHNQLRAEPRIVSIQLRHKSIKSTS